MASGTIRLYSWDGALLKTHRYRSVSERKSIMATWAYLYRKNISYSYVHVIPNVEEGNVSEKGENRRKTYFKLDR